MRREIKGRGVLHHQNGVVREAPFYRSPTMRGTNGVRMDPRRGPQPVRPFGCRPGSTRRRHTRFWLGGKGSDNMTEARVKSHITQRNIMQFRIDPRLASCVQHAQSPSSLRSPTGAKAIMTAHERRLQWRGTLAVVCAVWLNVPPVRWLRRAAWYSGSPCAYTPATGRVRPTRAPGIRGASAPQRCSATVPRSPRPLWA